MSDLKTGAFVTESAYLKNPIAIGAVALSLEALAVKLTTVTNVIAAGVKPTDTTTPHYYGLTASLAAPIAKSKSYTRVGATTGGFSRTDGGGGTMFANALIKPFLEGNSESINNGLPLVFAIVVKTANGNVSLGGTYKQPTNSTFAVPTFANKKLNANDVTPVKGYIGDIAYYAPIKHKDSGEIRYIKVATVGLKEASLGWLTSLTPAAIKKFVAFTDVNAFIKAHISSEHNENEVTLAKDWS
jgi:hypothetical protein